MPYKKQNGCITAVTENEAHNQEVFNANEQAIVDAMRLSANHISWQQPPASSWKELQEKIQYKKGVNHSKPTTDLWKVFSSIAASVFLLLIGGVIYQQSLIQHELKEIRLSNQLVEEQLLNNFTELDVADDIFHQVLLNEQLMEGATSEQEIVKLLEKRQQLIQLMIEKKTREDKNEIISL